MHLACDLSAAKTAQCCWTPAESSLVWWLNQNRTSAPSFKPRKRLPPDLMGAARFAPGRQRVRGATGNGARVLETQWLLFFPARAGLEVEQEFPDPLGRKRRSLAAGLLGVGFRGFHIAFSFGGSWLYRLYLLLFIGIRGALSTVQSAWGGSFGLRACGGPARSDVAASRQPQYPLKAG